MVRWTSPATTSTSSGGSTVLVVVAVNPADASVADESGVGELAEGSAACELDVDAPTREECVAEECVAVEALGRGFRRCRPSCASDAGLAITAWVGDEVSAGTVSGGWASAPSDSCVSGNQKLRS